MAAREGDFLTTYGGCQGSADFAFFYTSWGIDLSTPGFGGLDHISDKFATSTPELAQFGAHQWPFDGDAQNSSHL